MTTDPRQLAETELEESQASWRVHLASCELCRRAERFGGLYCGRGRAVYRDFRAAKRLYRRMTEAAH